jgi:hypothetical protein
VIGSGHFEFLVQKIRRYRKIVLGIGRGFEFLFDSRPNAGFPHYPGHTVFPAPNAVIDKVPMDFGSTVYTVVGHATHGSWLPGHDSPCCEGFPAV